MKTDEPNDSVTVISKATGLPRAELLAIWDQVKSNQALLNACPRHSFEPALAGNRKRKCSACGGTAGVNEAAWYEDGLRHADVSS